MKRFILDFLRRGAFSCGIGPIVLAILYLILHGRGVIDTLTVEQVCVGILSLTVLAFVAGGLNALYRIERLPLMGAISIHGGALYVSYLGVYLLNDWLKWDPISLLVFSGIFVVGYVTIWIVIYSIIKKRTASVNQLLKMKQGERVRTWESARS